MNLSLETTSFQTVGEIQIPDIFNRRIKTGIKAFDEIFGYGLLPGSSVTITAKAGCGKTTFLLQLGEALCNNGYAVGYASGEESRYQLAFNCRRLGVKKVQIANVTDIDDIVAATEKFDVLVVDSFQAVTSKHDLNSQELIKYAVTSIVKAAKANECVVFFVMHLTTTGIIKGGTLVPHAVDVNMKIENDPGSDDQQARVISFDKNRFGPCVEYNGIMGDKGFIFSGVRERTDDTASSKVDRMKTNIQKVLAMKEPPHITKKRVIKELNVTSAQAYVLLKEMTDRDLIVKFGRGDDAVYKSK